MTEIAARHYASLAVPRYTSYPTAADFSPAVGKDQYEAWLRRLRQGNRFLSIFMCLIVVTSATIAAVTPRLRGVIP